MKRINEKGGSAGGVPPARAGVNIREKTGGEKGWVRRLLIQLSIAMVEFGGKKRGSFLPGVGVLFKDL